MKVNLKIQTALKSQGMNPQPIIASDALAETLFRSNNKNKMQQYYQWGVSLRDTGEIDITADEAKELITLVMATPQIPVGIGYPIVTELAKVK